MSVVHVPSWNEVDICAMAARARAIAFDLDNTLACSRKPMKAPLAERVALLTQLMPVAIISGGKFQLVTGQVTEVLPPDADLSNMHLMPTSGTLYYRWNGHGWTQVHAYNLSAEDCRLAVDALERNARAQGLWAERVWGDRIENRGSQITFSALGQQAPGELKAAWDPDNEKKNRLARAVAAELPHLEVRPGGMTSVDVYMRGRDKSHAICDLAQSLGIEPGDIIFVGDRMTPDGNDYPAALAGTMAVQVTGPDDTLRFCNQLIGCLR